MRTSFNDARVGAMAKQFCQEQGLLIRAVAGNSLAFCPPLIISEEQIDEMIIKFGAALEQTLIFAMREKLLAL
jgi:adenosylmethionine-8-amino-7-oxononanoate aminotransferase